MSAEENIEQLQPPEFKFLRINGIAGNFYNSNGKHDTILIYGIGAPRVPDNGDLPDAPIILKRGVDVFVPDYIGYGRSDGDFTPDNCIRTFTILFEEFTSGCVGKNSYESLSMPLKYNRIIYVGRSLGGTYIPILPRFDQRIKELAIFCPVVDSKNCGAVDGEETNEQFIKSMEEDGYYHLYRGVLNPIWIRHLENMDNLSPMENIKFLQNAKLFIGHGMKDEIVGYQHSQEYFEKLLKEFPDKKEQFTFKIYPDGRHDKSTTNPAISDFLDWLNIK